MLKRVLHAYGQLNKISDPDVLINQILYEARAYTNSDAGSIYIMQGELLIPYSAQNKTLSKDTINHKIYIENIHVPIGAETISGYVAATHTTLNIHDVYHLPENMPYQFDSSFDNSLGYHSTSMLVVPLKKNSGELIGVLQLINKKTKQGKSVPFKRDDVFLIDYFANIASIALEHAQFTRSMITRMISMAELHDPYETSQHINRVAGYSTELYTSWAMSRNLPTNIIEKNRDIIRLAAMLHDVGKIAISDLILKKKGKITQAEHQVIESHTWKGALLFKDAINEIEYAAMEVSLTHHEHWDGSGYPGYVDSVTKMPPKSKKPRKEKEIPLFGRITTISDVYDALRSKRVYKRPWDEDKTLTYIQKRKGKQFDPELTDLFCNCISSINNITKYYED